MILASGHPVHVFDRIDSTNLEARRCAENGAGGPCWFWAEEQTAGRGRIGRQWVSKPGNLYATFLFPVAAGPQVVSQVSFVTALAVHDVVASLRPDLHARIKWPNDVLIDGAKFCGVLPEAVASNPTRIAIGCGINVSHAPEGTPYPVTCLGAGIAVESVLRELDTSLSERLKIWDEGRGFSAIRAAWSARALGVGEAAVADMGGNALQGIFEGLAADGALILRLADGSRRSIHSGEVRFATLERLRAQ